MVVSLRDEYVVHWFRGDDRIHTGAVVRHAYSADAVGYLAEIGSTLRLLRERVGAGPAGEPLPVVLALDGELDRLSGLVSTTSLWESREVHPGELLERFIGPVSLDLTDIEPVLARAALACSANDPDAVTAVVQLGYRMALHLGVGGRLTGGEQAERIIEGVNHRALPGHDRLCRCGKRGCLATVLGSNSLVDRYQAAGGRAAVRVGRGVVLAASDGDRIAQGVLDDAVTSLALALEPWLDMLGPRHLVITGAGVAEPLGREMLSQLADRLPPHQRSLPVTIVPLAEAAAAVVLP